MNLMYILDTRMIAWRKQIRPVLLLWTIMLTIKLMFLAFPSSLCIRSKRDTGTLTTWNWTPGMSPTAWPLQPNPATRTSSFSSIKFKQPSLVQRLRFFFSCHFWLLNSDTLPNGRIWLFGFSSYFFNHSSLGMRCTSKRVGCQSCAQMGFLILFTGASQVVLVVKNSPANAGAMQGWILEWGKFPEGEHGNPPQYSCLENPMDRGAWQATVYRITKSQTWLKQLNMHVLFIKSFPVQSVATELPGNMKTRILARHPQAWARDRRSTGRITSHWKPRP